jgi:hypothetical protein
MMAVLPHRPRLTPEQREALELLASEPQGATEELLVLAHVPGFASKEEAQRWIEEKATTWLSAQGSAPELHFAVSRRGH